MNTKKIPSIGGVGLMAGALACAGLLSAGAAGVRGSAAYTQGFEHNTNGWNISGSSGYSITRYHSDSGASPLGSISAASGNYYAVITNNENNNGTNLGDAGYAILGGGSSTYSGPDVQSVSVYVPVTGIGAWGVTGKAGSPQSWGSSSTGYGFEIDETANNSSASYTPNFNTEVDIQFSVPTAGTVDVNASTGGAAGGVGIQSLATITASGWYTFALTYYKTGNGTTDPVGVKFAAYDNSENEIGSTSDSLKNAASSGLGGDNYLWITNWASGFGGVGTTAPNNGGVLAIDNVFPVVTPIPGSGFLAAVGGFALIGGLALRRRMAKLQ